MALWMDRATSEVLYLGAAVNWGCRKGHGVVQVPWCAGWGTIFSSRLGYEFVSLPEQGGRIVPRRGDSSQAELSTKLSGETGHQLDSADG